MPTFTQASLGLAAALAIACAVPTLASADVKTSAAPEGKPAVVQRGKGNPSGVLMRHTVPDKIAVGETVTLRLQFSGVTAADGATVEVRDLGARTTLVSTHLAQGEQRTLEIPYTSRADGMQFVDVITMQAGRATVQTLPLRVGTGELKLKPHGQRQTTATGESVISLPAATPAPGANR